jgi:hypothetical protein
VIRNRLWALLAYTRIPGNALSFWIRQTLHWSRGIPKLPQEPKDGLFDYLNDDGDDDADKSGTDAGKESARAEAREADLRERYHLEPLARASTAALYRKNLYLIDILEKATEGLPVPAPGLEGIKALDVGSQDWHYVFGLERWLRFADYADRTQGRTLDLTGLELDGYGIYPDFHSRKDYAQAYAAQTGNPGIRYAVGDFLKSGVLKSGVLQNGEEAGGYDAITIFYPFVTRYQLLLWGLPLRFFSPRNFLARAAALTRPGGWLVVFCHSLREHELFLEMGKATETYTLLREGPALSDLVDFYEDVQDRRYSVWRKRVNADRRG